MKRIKHISILLILISFLFLNLPIKLSGQENARYIFLMRPRSFLGSGNKMDIQINGISIYKLKNARRLIIISNTDDSVKFQIIYPLMPKYRSRIFWILPEDEQEIYLECRYEGNGRNFRIEVAKMDAILGKERFYSSGYYNVRKNKIKMIKTYSNKLYVSLTVCRIMKLKS